MNLVNSAYRDCVEVLEAHAEALNAATDELLKGEQLTGQELEKIMKVSPPPPLPPPCLSSPPPLFLTPLFPKSIPNNLCFYTPYSLILYNTNAG